MGSGLVNSEVTLMKWFNYKFVCLMFVILKLCANLMPMQNGVWFFARRASECWCVCACFWSKGLTLRPHLVGTKMIHNDFRNVIVLLTSRDFNAFSVGS